MGIIISTVEERAPVRFAPRAMIEESASVYFAPRASSLSLDKSVSK